VLENAFLVEPAVGVVFISFSFSIVNRGKSLVAVRLGKTKVFQVSSGFYLM
jgi:hypothetical protein